MLLKIGHFSSTVAPKMVMGRNVKFPMIFRKFWGGRGQSICIRKWHISTVSRGSKSTTRLVKSGPQEAAVNFAEIGPL